MVCKLVAIRKRVLASSIVRIVGTLIVAVLRTAPHLLLAICLLLTLQLLLLC